MAAILPFAPIGSAFPFANALLPAHSPAPPTGNFGALMAAGLRDIDGKVAHADALIQAFAQGEPIPVHQVTLALEEARLSVEVAMQVRTRLVEAYRDFMNMQI